MMRRVITSNGTPSTEAPRGEAKVASRRSLAAYALGAGLVAFILAGLILDPDTPHARVPPRLMRTFAQPNEALSATPISRNATRRIAGAGIDGDDTGTALGDLELALEAAPEEELDLIAVARLPHIVRRDPHRAARFIELTPPSERRAVLIRHFSRLWGERDAEGALAWARSLPDAGEATVARRAICLSLSQTNPRAAVERCAENDADVAGEGDFQGIFQTWAESDPASASAWLVAQPPSARLDKLRQRYVHVLARTSPHEALRMTQEGFTVAADRDEALLTVLHQWGLQDLHAAREWAENNAAGDVKSRALAELDGLESYAVNR
jgi:hypothetical protein